MENTEAVRHILDLEIERLEKQIKSLSELVDREQYHENILRLNGKIEGVELAIENLRQTIKEV